MLKRTFRLLWPVTVLLFFALSCNTVNDFTQQAAEIRETAVVIGTDLSEGQDLLATGQAALATAGESGPMQTLEAFATREGPGLQQTAAAWATEQGPSIRDTAVAFATEQGPALLATAKAFATREGSGIRETLAAFATEEGPGIRETVQALELELPEAGGEPPTDVPVFPGNQEDRLASSSFVSYNAASDVDEVANFYATAMPANGWVLSSASSDDLAGSRLYHFTKGERSARLSITPVPGTGGTVVLILITGG